MREQNAQAEVDDRADAAKRLKAAIVARREHVVSVEKERAAAAAAAANDEAAIAQRAALAAEAAAAEEALAVPSTVRRSKVRINYANTRFHEAGAGGASEVTSSKVLFGTTAADMAREYVFASIQRHAALEPAPEPRPMPPAPTMEPPMPSRPPRRLLPLTRLPRRRRKAPGGVVPQPDSGVLVAWTDTPLGELEGRALTRG